MRFINSNVFIYNITRHPSFYKTARDILMRLERGEEMVTCTLVLEEIFVFLDMKKSAKHIPLVMDSIRSYSKLKIVDYEYEDMVRAMDILRKQNFSLDWDDALILSVMERLGVNEIYSNDTHFDVEGIKRVFE